MLVFSVHNAKRGITVLQLISNNPHRTHIKQFIKSEAFLLHFAPDAVDVFRATADFSVNPGLLHLSTQVADKITNVLLTHDATLRKLFGDLFIGIRLLVTKRVVFNFPFELTNAKAVSQWRIDVGTLFGSHAAHFIWLVFHFTQVADPLGKLNHHAAEIIHHRQ
ncbi:Uncharacterised protein [Vibrio cholerae]|nr:Uncharacterised protein [Vibrio cholerae]